ncbi:hypothetical protein O2N63_07485 [Aliiroseovarius sp. KMU-50]|uniref:Uncharacterized protein n=1 Tax=Aliiroseovarius salicola TaxID=3009082 RepID=A0ABT4W0B1_9RHOB|nr:hypothetical protein [Aliiroseovarius sp. KMU-50]MDA5093927.1 hypothetical protein [Aliiroseovarius sp. KMU-50]
MTESEFFAASALVFKRLGENVSLSQLHSFLPDLAPELIPTGRFDALIDLSEVKELDSNYTKISSLISTMESLYQTHVAPHRIAFLAPGDLAFGTCRMVEQLAQGRLPTEMLVTRDPIEAILYLAREETTIDQLQDALTRAESDDGFGCARNLANA